MMDWKEPLENILLPLGGESISFPKLEEDLDKILTRGLIWTPKNRIFMKGEISQCHRNTCRLWYANKDQVQIATGYALYDEKWIQHSWGIQKNRVVETTLPWEKYYGYVMTDEEANDFYFDNE
jgi:hypothetical protein